MSPGSVAAHAPDRAAVIMVGSGEVVTYRQLDERSNQMAWLFRGLGLTRGDVVAVLMDNDARLIELYWAALRSGLYFTTISTRLTAGEIRHILDDSGARVLVVSSRLSAVAREASRDLPGLVARLMSGPADAMEADQGFQPLSEALAGCATSPVPDETLGADMLYSSGTTGRPKGIKRPLSGQHPDVPTEMTLLLARLYDLSETTRYLSTAPLYHSAPLRFVMRVHNVGGTVIVMEHFDAALALRAIGEHRVTHSQWVPTMFSRLLRLPEEARAAARLDTHRVAIHGAAPCPPAVKRAMIDWWGPILFEYYGGTEGNGYCALSAREWLAHPGSVGRALIGTVKIVGEDGEECPVGAEGTVYFADAPSFAYHNDPEKTAQAFNDKGWSTLGDMGRLDDQGYLYLTDRKAFMIISGGVNIYPQETENVLLAHPLVADAAVFGIPNAEFGEEVKAVVQLHDGVMADGALEAALIQFCRERLSPLKCPRSIDFEAEMPRHPTGKLYKRLLRDRYWAGRASRIV